MKLKQFFYSIMLIWSVSSCTEVIDVELPTEQPNLVVEADLLWEKGSSGALQTIQLSLSSDFYDSGSPTMVSDATVTVTNLITNTVFDFLPKGNGTYQCDVFVPQFDAQYQLNISYNGEEYQAREQFYPVADIDRTEQSVASGFDGGDVLSIDTYIKDPAGIENYYLVVHDVNSEQRPYISVWDDEFQDGNEFAIIYRAFFTGREDFELEENDVVDISISGISKSYSNYMYILTEQAYGGGDPFGTTPVQLKGNIVNSSDETQRAFGYFRLSEVVTDELVIQ